MKTAERLVPELRFPGYDGAWGIRRLEKLCSTFKSGNSITSGKIFDEGQYPVFGGNGLRGYTNDYTHDGNYFLIGRQGALCGNIRRTNGKSFISEHAIAVCSNEHSDTEWLAQRLDYKNLNRLSESSAQPGLSVNKLLRLKIITPSLPEQQKIASFLSAVDKKIEKLTRKKELLQTYKKGLMQKIFSRQIRFKDDNGNNFPDWEEKRLGEIAKKITKKNKGSIIHSVLTNSAKEGIINQADYFEREIANKDNLDGYYIVAKNDFVYNPRISKYAPVGPIKRNKIADGLMSPLYLVFRFDELILWYYEFFFATSFWHKYMQSIANFGARHDRMNITTNDFFKMPVPYLCIKEQQKIVNFLTSIDKKIDAVDKQLSQTQTFKKGLLQKMFV